MRLSQERTPEERPHGAKAMTLAELARSSPKDKVCIIRSRNFCVVHFVDQEDNFSISNVSF
jgi:hypothetical protein